MSVVETVPTMEVPSPDEVRDAMAAVMRSPSFTASPRRKKLLGYLVERCSEGGAARLKAIDIAVDVLGRDERFDPQQDPIVRLEVGRLRRDLEHYYLTAGARDRLRIDIPKGGYVPTFSVVELAVGGAEAEAATPRLRRPWAQPAVLGLVLAACAVAGSLGLWLQYQGQTAPGTVRQERGPSILVMPLESLSGESAELLATGLTNALIDRLVQIDSLQVYAAPGPEAAHPPSAPAATLRVEGSVARDAANINASLHLIEAATGRVLWSGTFDRTTTIESVLAVQDELATRIAEQLAPPNGALAVSYDQAAGSRPSSLFAYDCVQRGYLYRLRSDGADHDAVIACLEQAVAKDPRYVEAWAMLAQMRMTGIRLKRSKPGDREQLLALAQAAATRAVELDPRNVWGLQALANVRFEQKAYAEAERLQRQAIALRPHNPDGLGQLGWRLIARGRLEEGAALMREAVERSYRSPAWVHQTLAVAYFLSGKLDLAHEEAVRGQGFCCGYGKATLAITAASLGQADEARAALAEAQAQSDLLVRDPRAFWQVFHVTDNLIDRLEAPLRGITLAASAAPDG